MSTHGVDSIHTQIDSKLFNRGDLMQYSSDELNILWKHFLAYQTQFHARDFVTLHSRNNQAQFIKIIRTLVKHPAFIKVDINIKLLTTFASIKILSSVAFTALQKLCSLIEEGDAFEKINSDDHVDFMFFKPFNFTQWQHYIEQYTPIENNSASASMPNTRRRIDPLLALALDVDLQQQCDIQHTFQLQHLQSIEHQQEQQQNIQPAMTQNPVIHFDAFWEQLIRNPLQQPSNISREALHYQWCHWTAGKRICIPSTPFHHNTSVERKLVDGDIQLTADAAMELFKWRHLFQAGIDINHLPAGFTLTQNKDIGKKDFYLLHYLSALKDIAEPDTLAIQCNAPLSFPIDVTPHLTLEEVKELFKDPHQHSEDSIKHLYDHVLKYFPDKTTLQQNDAYMEALHIILNLPLSQRRWWEQLFEQHHAHCGQDDFPSLVASFQTFLKQITQYHQNLHFYPPQFNSIKSLPVALTLILALLEPLENEDKVVQWQTITALPLTGYEVGKALRTSHFSSISFNEVQKPCRFIIPEMAVEEINHFKGQYDLLFPSHLNWHDAKYKQANRLFYLALSHKQFRLPIRFYQEKMKDIDQLLVEETTKKYLCYILLESCTGTRSTFILKSPEHIPSQWALFFKTIKALTQEEAKEIIKILFTFTDTPEIHLLNTMLADVNEFNQKFRSELKQNIYYLNRLSEQWDTRKAHQLILKKKDLSFEKVWDIGFCFKQHYQAPDYLSLALIFDFVPALKYSKQGSAHFNQALSDVLNRSKTDERSYFLSKRILDKLSCLTCTSSQLNLTVEQFIAFSNAVFEEATQHQTDAHPKYAPEFDLYFKQDTDTSFETFYQDADFIDRLLREQFPHYVNEDVLALSELSTADHEQLNLTIKNRVTNKNAQVLLKSILTELSFDRSRTGGHAALLDKLIILINHTSNEEWIECLLNIRTHLAFGKLLSKESNRGFESRLDQLNELLQIIIERNAITHFQFLMAEFEQLSEPQTMFRDAQQDVRHQRNVIKKLSYSFSKLLVLMEKALSPTSHIQGTAQLVFCKAFLNTQSAHRFVNQDLSFQKDEALFIRMIQAIDDLGTHYPIHARALNDFFIGCYEQSDAVEPFVPTSSHSPLMPNQADLPGHLKSITTVCKELVDLNDPDLVLSMIHRTGKDHKNNLFDLQTLKYLFIHCPTAHKKELFNILIEQCNQNPEQINTTILSSFLDLINQEQHNKNFSKALNICFSQLPLPKLEIFIQWWNSGNDSIQDKYQAFIQDPFPRDTQHNGFIFEKALQQVQSQEMANIASRYTTSFLQNFSHDCLLLRNYSLTELKHALDFAKNNADPSFLVAAVSEHLFRSTGQELNTTQYLAVDALLSTGKHITSEIDTGEGKTRIAILLLACCAYVGQTCDFVTSDMQLAETAYLTYNSFFKSLGIPCKLIRSESDLCDYQFGAIHFSDCGNFSLFRNKATSIGKLNQTLNPNPTHRTLLLDESDKTWFDLYNISYNFSMSADHHLNDMEWVYTQLILFFSEDGHHLNLERMEYYYDDVAQCTEQFKTFVKTYGSAIQVAQLNNISDEKIARWHEAAVTALNLRYQIDFALNPNARIQTHKGPKVASEAWVITNYQINKSSKFSNGVHQCLSARLNLLRHQPLQENSSDLDKDLHEQCTQPFYIAPESQIITTSSSETFLNFYTEGHLYGMTGTAGAEIEKKEVEAHFSLTDDASNTTHFIKMPRHNANLRIDHALTIVPKNKDKIDRLVEHILASQDRNQSVLIFCDHDKEAVSILKQLKQKLQSLNKDISLHHIQSTTSTDEQSAYLTHEAGKPGVVTLSTGLLGRGKDILLHHTTDDPSRDAAQYGLRIIELSYPHDRELRQHLGRAARHGQPGETYILLSEEELKTKYNLKGSNAPLEQLLLKRQRSETDNQQLERRIKMSLHAYLIQYQTAYFSKLQPVLEQNQVLLTPAQSFLWINVFHEMTLTKQKALNDLMEILHHPSFSAQQYRLITDKLHLSLQTQWHTFLNALQAASTTSKIEINLSIHKIELQHWEKKRILEIKNEQLRPLREKIVLDEIKSKESFWVWLHRQLYAFAQWINWCTLAKYLDECFHFSKPIPDSEIEPLIYSAEEPESEKVADSYSNIQKTLSQAPPLSTYLDPLASPDNSRILNSVINIQPSVLRPAEPVLDKATTLAL